MIKKSPARKKPSNLFVIVRFFMHSLYGWSDSLLEEETVDRRSFQIFVEWTSADLVPNATTICRYRELFSRLKLDDLLFRQLKKQLKALGLILGKGTWVDATIKKAQANLSSKRNQDADDTQKGKKCYYGYKGYIGVDCQTQVIHDTTNIHNSTVFAELLSNTGQVVIGDKGYANQLRKSRLRSKGTYCGILDKGYRNRKLSNKQRRRNQQLSSIHDAVERPFAFMNHVLNYERCSYYNIARNRFQFTKAVFIYNLRKMLVLTA